MQFAVYLQYELIMEHRFHLQKYRRGNKGMCPNCNRPNCFVRYVDEEGMIAFTPDIGRCDHENSCGYHKTPRDYFINNPHVISYSENTKYIKSQRLKEIKSTSYINENIVKATLGHYSINPMFQYIDRIFGHEECLYLFKRYRIGTSSIWNGSTIFWQTDLNGRVRTGKIMDYNPLNGKRIKDPINRINWAHSVLKIPDFNLKQCFFGEHLLKNSTKSVAIVESEKTALIAAHYMPDYLWLATGGKHGCFNSEAIKVLSGRRVLLVPDLNAYKDWKEKEPMFRKIGCKINTFKYFENNAKKEQICSGLDIGDFLLAEKTPHQIMFELIDKNPLLKKLINELNLTICK